MISPPPGRSRSVIVSSSAVSDGEMRLLWANLGGGVGKAALGGVSFEADRYLGRQREASWQRLLLFNSGVKRTIHRYPAGEL